MFCLKDEIQQQSKIVSKQTQAQALFIKKLVELSQLFFRIVDNMPVTWCYDVEDGQKYCNPGFPIGCLVTTDGRAKDACVINVSCDFFYLGSLILQDKGEVVVIKFFEFDN